MSALADGGGYIAGNITMQDTIIRDYTKGPVFKQLLIFALPMFLANILQIIYNIADMIIVGKAIGSVGLSAVSVGGDLSQIITFLIMGFAKLFY